jgi:excisionase family DNA binding protein
VPTNEEWNMMPALLMPAEVARLFAVNTKTVSKWAREGKISCIETLGKHRRYSKEEVRKLLQVGVEDA